MPPSKRLIAAYTLDWVVIVGFAAIGGGLNFVSSVGRPFSLLDLSISYPLVTESVSLATLALSAFVAPAVIIALVALLVIPGRPARQSLTRGRLIKRRLWELHNGLAGLALSVALAFFVTQGLKNIVGKPRPHLLALCQPDLTNIAKHVVGGYGQEISPRWTLVNKSICTQPDSKSLNDGFRSFPSGHASWSWSGLLYLSLFLASKFAVAIPYLPHSLSPTNSTSTAPPGTAHSTEVELLPLHKSAEPSDASARPFHSKNGQFIAQEVPLYNRAATPPNWGIVLVLIPVAGAAYITSTRYFEFWHFGLDVLGGALIGVVSAWFSFRWYHTPIRRGRGWAWGSRSPDRAFGIGVGMGYYVDSVTRSTTVSAV